MIEGFNRESYLGSQDEYLMESPELSNGRPRSEAAGQQSVYVSMPDPYPDENGSFHYNFVSLKMVRFLDFQW